LIRSDYTFLNERLARHYGIPDVYGSRFRRVTLGPDSKRGGLLRHGSVLAVTSYATRTSPIIRGVWVLGSIFGAPPPPPLPNVPSLDESTVSASLPMRERLAAHRTNAVCASCHRTIDPVGFSLESFNAIGQWRDHEADDVPIDVSGALPGVGELRGSPLAQRQAHAERLLNSPVPFFAFELTLEGETVTCGQIALENDLVGIYDVFSAVASRGRGHATLLCRHLLAQARARGARHAYLQVEADNLPARAVYGRLGFVDAYAYHYRTRNPDAA